MAYANHTPENELVPENGPKKCFCVGLRTEQHS